MQSLHHTAPLIAPSRRAYARSRADTTHAHTKARFFHAVQRQLRQLSFDLERKVASDFNDDRHSRNKRSAVIRQKTRARAKCITRKKTEKKKHAKSTGKSALLEASLIHTGSHPPTHTHTRASTHPAIMLYNQKAFSHFSRVLRASQVRGLSVH